MSTDNQQHRAPHHGDFSLSKPAYRYAYLHGFASGARSYKGVELAATFRRYGAHLCCPDLNSPSFSKLTYTGSLAVMSELDKEDLGTKWRLIGSSMGGYLAARWAQLNPDRVDRLLLLCPGFDLPARWPQMIGQDAIDAWQRTGEHLFERSPGEHIPVWWQFMEDALTHPKAPNVTCPTRIIHGTQDATVPVESSRAYANAHPLVELIEVNSDHGLGSALPEITREALEFFKLKPVSTSSAR